MPSGATDKPAALPVQPSVEVKSLEYWLTRATDPYLEEAGRGHYITGFTEQVNVELEGPQVACRLLAHKIQSPYEVEALHGLTVLESCVCNCGVRFYNEIGKFKFLNELIKILSPKYLGAQTSDRIKQKVVELLYSWKQTLRHLPKIGQAYDMLKEQRIIIQDPTYMDEMIELPKEIPTTHRLAPFEDEEKSKLLNQLLRSKNPEDLQAANRLIKSMVKADDQKAERTTKRQEDLERATTNAQLLSEMIANFNVDVSSQQDVDLMREFASSLQTLRPVLFRYAGEAAESEEAILANVLTINDEVSKSVDDYRAKVEGKTVTQKSQPAASSSLGHELSSLLSFEPATTSIATLVTPDLPSTNSEISIASDDVGMIGRSSPKAGRLKESEKGALEELSEVFGPPSSLSAQAPKSDIDPILATLKDFWKKESPRESEIVGPKQPTEPKQKGLLDLDQLSESLIESSLPQGTASTFHNQKLFNQRQKVPMREMNRQTSPALAPKNTHEELGGEEETDSQDGLDMNGVVAAPSLDDVQIPVESIQPGNRSPVTVVDRDQVRVVLHYAGNRPKPGVAATVLNLTSTHAQPLTEVSLRVSSSNPQEVSLKVEPASGSALPAYNPIFPQSAISQLLLLAFPPASKKACLDYTLGYTVAGEKRTEHCISGSFEVEYRSAD